jgi:heme-degrading monooxygenase HmoA
VEESVLIQSNTISSNQIDPQALIAVTRYKTRFIPFAFLSMAMFHIPLFFNKRVIFYKLMGCGRNGSFDIQPDFNQWAVMIFFKPDSATELGQGINQATRLLGRLINHWWRLFGVQRHLFLLEPYAGHGTWDGKSFIDPPAGKITDPPGRIGVLTRASIRLSRLRQFWGAVSGAAEGLSESKGFQYSVGIGEVPFIKQATFSVWSSAEDMKNYAYKKVEHQEVIRRTRKEDWYTEEMFLRFSVLEESQEGISLER